MKVKRTGRFKVKASHPDYEMIKLHIRLKGKTKEFMLI